jgi:hypothetical protein
MLINRTQMLCRHISHLHNQSCVIRLWQSLSFFLSNPALPLTECQQKQVSRPPCRIDIHMCSVSRFTARTKTFNNNPIFAPPINYISYKQESSMIKHETDCLK